jgi:hypothetical protein
MWYQYEGSGEDDRRRILAASGLDVSLPNVARIYDFLLGGKDNFAADADQPREAVRGLTEALVPGSALALSHVTGEGTAPAAGRAVQQVYQGASAPLVPRSREDIAGFFDGLDLVEPGVTDISRWPGRSPGPAAPLTFFGGLARKPGRR